MDLPQITIWFPDEYDFKLFKAATGYQNYKFKLRFDNKEALVDYYVGESFPDNKDYAALILFIPQTGVTDNIARKFKDNENQYICRIFKKEEGYIPRWEDSPVKNLYIQVKDLFLKWPFFSIQDDEKLQFNEWLSKVMVSAYNIKSLVAFNRDLQKLEYDANRIILQKKIESMEDLERFLLEHSTRKDNREHLKRLTENIKSANITIRDQLEEMRILCQTNYDKTVSIIHKFDYKWKPGDDLAPELRRIYDKLYMFLKKLENTKIEHLKDIASEVSEYICQRPPVLALVGPFSSGKTMLLNAILLGAGQKGYKSFRTKNIANTAIVYEIYSAESGENEQAIYKYRDKIDHKLISTGEPTFPKNGEALINLIFKGIITSPAITCEESINPPSDILAGFKGSKAEKDALKGGLTRDNKIADLPKIIEFLKGIGSSRKMPFLKARFSGKVSKENLRKSELPEAIDLRNEEGWLKFQGDPSKENDKPFIESPEATFLIEKVNVKLQCSLLQITTIADTPGTGSYNDRHDLITDEYFARAEGFLVLLPTKGKDTTRVKKMIEKLYEVMSKKHHNEPAIGLDYIAFIVNCFTTVNSDQDQLEAVRFYEKTIASIFKMSKEEWDRRKRKCFFVINLKRICQGDNIKELYGYASIIPLRNWIKSLFLKKPYTAKLNNIINIIDQEWLARMRILEKIVYKLKYDKSAFDYNKIEIDKYYKQGLKEDKNREIMRLREIGNELQRCFNKAEEYLDEFIENPETIEDLDSIHRKLKMQYNDINNQLDDFRESPPIKSWLKSIKVKLEQFNIAFPPLIPPDPAKQDIPWSFNLFLSIPGLDEKLAKIGEKWPKKMHERLWEWLKDKIPFCKHSRKTMAEDIKDYFSSHRGRIEKPLKLYLDTCCNYLDNAYEKIVALCKKDLDNLGTDNKDTDSKIADIDKKIEEIRKFDADRNVLLRDLDNYLNKEEK